MLRLDRVVLATLDKFCRSASEPFSGADSLQTYATAGFLFLGVVVGIVLLTIAVLTNPLDEPAGWLRTIYQIAIQRLPLKVFPADPRSVLLVPVALYVAVYFWTPARIWLGEKFANGVFWLAERFLVVGEWCLEHRWPSLFMIIALGAALGYGINRGIEKARRHDLVTRDYEHWLTLEEYWLEHTSFTHAEEDKYKNARQYWRDEFGDVGDSIIVGRSGICLKDMLDDLYSTDDQGTWVDRLTSAREALEKTISSCRQERRGAYSQQRALSLMHLLMGRVYSRVFDVTRDAQDLANALDHLNKVEHLDPAHANDPSPYHSSVTNAKGTVYADLVTVFPSGSIIAGRSLPEAILQLCHSASDCAQKSLRAYEEAGHGYAKCSFEDTRKINNEADLLIRMAQRYPEMLEEQKGSILNRWFESPEVFAAELERRANALLSCAGTGNFVAATLLTAAQAFGAAADLRPNISEEAALDARASGFYLQLASSFEPNEVTQWDLSYFCFTITNQALEREFKNYLTPLVKGPISEEQLIALVRKQCH